MERNSVGQQRRTLNVCIISRYMFLTYVQNHVINNKLTPSEHIQILVSKSNRKIHMIKRCFSGLTPLKISVLYTSIIRPVLEYASVTWSPWLKKDILALEKIQKRCLGLCRREMVPLESL